MIEARSLAYLEAMGIDAWTLRSAGRSWDRLVIGPGVASTLLVCNNAEETATRLAADIGRALNVEPVWAWPDPDEQSAQPTLESTVEQRLFTSVLVFGEDLGQRIFKGAVPELLGSAKIQVADSMQDLAASGVARRALWRLMVNDLAIHSSRS